MGTKKTSKALTKSAGESVKRFTTTQQIDLMVEQVTKKAAEAVLHAVDMTIVPDAELPDYLPYMLEVVRHLQLNIQELAGYIDDAKKAAQS